MGTSLMGHAEGPRPSFKPCLICFYPLKQLNATLGMTKLIVDLVRTYGSFKHVLHIKTKVYIGEPLLYLAFNSMTTRTYRLESINMRFLCWPEKWSSHKFFFNFSLKKILQKAKVDWIISVGLHYICCNFEWIQETLDVFVHLHLYSTLPSALPVKHI